MLNSSSTSHKMYEYLKFTIGNSKIETNNIFEHKKYDDKQQTCNSHPLCRDKYCAKYALVNILLKIIQKIN